MGNWDKILLIGPSLPNPINLIYQFKTNFIPGIGIITDPQAYQDQWQKSMEEKE